MIDEKRAQWAVEFFRQVLTHTKAPYSGQDFDLQDWQKDHLTNIFGTVRPDGKRQYRTVWFEVGKKNGKSELGAGIAVMCMAMALYEKQRGFEVYSCAATRHQAALVFNVAAQMIRNRPFLSDQFKIIDSTKTILAKEDITTFYKALSSDADINDGVNPCVCIFDEVHRQKTSELWNVMKYGMVTRDEPLMIGLTTAGTEADSPLAWDKHCYARQLLDGVHKDDSFYPIIYSMPENADWKDEENWYKANPALGTFKKLEAVREDFREALRTPRLENDFRRLHLNEWCSQETRWIPLSEWNACEEAFNPWELEGKTCFGGLDLSSTTDLTALVLLFPGEERLSVLPWFWMPEDNLRERAAKDNVPYERWRAAGLIETTPGNVVDYAFIRRRAGELAELYQISEMAYDPWNAMQTVVELGQDGMTMVPVRQGYGSLSPPSKALEAAVLQRHIRHAGHPVLGWMMDCCSVRTDPAGNIKPVKPDRTKSSKRIDGVVALVMALDRLTRHQRFVSQYANPETAVM